MPIAIGFPLVEIENSEKSRSRVVAAYLSEGPLNGAQNTVRLQFRDRSPRETTLEVLFGNPAFGTFDARLLGGNRQICLNIEADEQDTDLAESLVGGGSINGYSATLALHLAQHYKFGAEYTPSSSRILVSVQCGAQKVVPLSNTEDGKRGLVAKWTYARRNASVSHALIVTRSDALMLQPVGTAEVPLNAPDFLSNAVSGNLLWQLPHAAGNGSLIHQLAQRLGLNPLVSRELNEAAAAPDIQGEATYTTRDLLAAAVQGETDWSRRALVALTDGTAALNDTFLNAELLDIQQQALADPTVFSCKSNVLVSGPTGSGKSRLMDAFILHTIFVEQKMCIYVAPTRALAGQFHRQFVARYAVLFALATGRHVEQEIVLSTGEEGRHDAAIRQGQVMLACMVTEKVNVLMSLANSRLDEFDEGESILGLVILDEMHMIANPSRGGVVDLLLSKLVSSSQRGTSPRVLGISTEDIAALLIKRGVFTRNGLPPVDLNTEIRPVAVRHVAMISGGGDGVEITNFSNSSDRYLDERQLRLKAKELVRNAEAAAALIRNRVDHREFYRKLINEKLNQFSLVIFSFGSYGELLDIGERLKCDRPLRSDNGEEVTYRQALVASDLTDRARERLEEWARHDIYLHTSNQAADIRAWVEDTFAQPLAGGRKVAILTTETLTYGVNLCADCVILGGTSFPRDTDGRPPADGDPPLEPLSANEFHNLLGRAGRYGLDSNAIDARVPHVAEAIFVMQRVEYENRSHRAIPPTEEQLMKLLSRYYVRPLQRDALFSGLLRIEDLNAQSVHSSRQARGRTSSKFIDASSLSFAALRTVCDAVRYIGTPTKEGLFDHLYDKTLFYGVEGLQMLTPEERDCHSDGKAAKQLTEYADAVFGAVLESASSNSSESSPLKLLVRDPDAGTYAITAKAEAIIDTGTRPWAIETIASWLGQLRVLFPSPEKLPAPEFLVFGFVATPEFWNVAAPELCEEATKAHRGEKEDGDKWKANADTSLALLKAELGYLGVENDVIDVLLPKAVAFLGTQMALGHRYLSFQSTFLRLSTYFKLISIILMWLRGAGVEEIVAKYPMVDQHGISSKKSSGAETLQSKFTDRLRWQAQATQKFFGEEPWFFRNFQRDLGDFASRLGMGIPAAGLPLIFGKGRRQRRKDVVVAIAAGATPGALLRTGLSGGEAAFSDAVLDYYRSQIEQLLGAQGKSALLSKNGGQEWEELKIVVLQSFRRGGATDGFIGTLFKWLSECWLRCEPQRNGCSLNAELRTIALLSSPGEAKTVFQFTDSQNIHLVLPGYLPVVIYGPGEVTSIPDRGLALSQVASIVLFDLLLRGYIRADKLILAASEPRAMLIRDIVLDLCDRLALGRAGQLAESLLAFDEPGARP